MRLPKLPLGFEAGLFVCCTIAAVATRNVEWALASVVNLLMIYRVRIAEQRIALRDDLVNKLADIAEEAISYVPPYFADKWWLKVERVEMLRAVIATKAPSARGEGGR